MKRTYVAISVVAVDVPASADDLHAAGKHLVACGLMAAIRFGRRWRFLNRAAAIGAGDSEDILLDWLARNLPQHATLIGWRLDAEVFPQLLSAAATSRPSVARNSAAALAVAAGPIAVDLALHHPHFSSLSLVDAAAEAAVGIPVMTQADTVSAWSFADTDRLEEAAGEQALGLWRLFTRLAAASGDEAEAATERWQSRRRDRRWFRDQVQEGRIEEGR